MVINTIGIILGVVVRRWIILNKSIEDWMDNNSCRWFTTNNINGNCPFFLTVRNVPIIIKKKKNIDTSTTKQPTEEA